MPAASISVKSRSSLHIARLSPLFSPIRELVGPVQFLSLESMCLGMNGLGAGLAAAMPPGSNFTILARFSPPAIALKPEILAEV
jgi:hypothetical protein